MIGGFDSARGGFSSVEFSSSMSNFRSHLAATYLDVAYDSTGTLTSDFLSGVDVLLIGVALTGTTPITPLSVAEQGALLNFVNTGGSALLFTDNNIQFEAASDSIAQPFGLDTSGVIVGSATATVTNTNHPVTNGPFGPVTLINYASFPGSYASLGPHAIELARLDQNNQVSLAVINHGVMSPSAGAAVFFADITIYDANYTGSTVILVDNALVYAGATPILRGDYNNDGTVDAADYVVWRKYSGTMTTLPNDPHGGTIGANQFNTWLAHFGQTAGGGLGASADATVPEPATLVLLMFAAAGWCVRRSRDA